MDLGLRRIFVNLTAKTKEIKKKKRMNVTTSN